MPPRKAATAGAAKKVAAKPTVNGTKSTKARDDKPTDSKKTKAAATQPSVKKDAPKTNGTKRKAAEEHEEAQVDIKTKKPKTEAPAQPSAARVTRKPVSVKKPDLSSELQIPNQKLDVFVFGEGGSGELGLGSIKYEGKKPIDVKRPRLNHNLLAEKVGVVQLACGGMHAVALTHDNRVLTWGVNDDKALGRDTTWDGGLKDMDADDDDDDDDDDTGINPRESTPTEVDWSQSGIEEGIRFIQVAATDSASFVLTNNGSIYGWGTFRGSDGIIGFTEDVRTQPTPVLIHELYNKSITQIACGSNHVVALDRDGKVYTWGSGGQYQLGRKPLARHGGPKAGLKPEACGRFTKRHFATKVAAGSYHSFYIDNKGSVWSWGLNNYAQTGHSENTGEDDAMVLNPTVVRSLEGLEVTHIAGGEHHSVASTKDGKLLTWGRVDGHQVGQPASLYNEDNAVFDANGKPRILTEPTAVPDIKASFVATGTDSSFALDREGKVYSWGFSANYQTGQGTTDDIETPTLIDNTAVRGKKLVWAGAGGQYGIVASEHEPATVNGH